MKQFLFQIRRAISANTNFSNKIVLVYFFAFGAVCIYALSSNRPCLFFDWDGADWAVVMEYFEQLASPFSLSMVDGLQGMFDVFHQGYRGLLPQNIVLRLVGLPPFNKLITLIVYTSGLLVAIYLMARAVDLEKGIALLSAFLYVVLMVPLFEDDAVVDPIIALSPNFAYVIAVGVAAIALYWQIDGRSIRVLVTRSVLISVLLGAVAWSFIYFFVYILFVATVICTAFVLSDLKWRVVRTKLVGAVVIAGSLVGLGIPTYLYDLASNTALQFFPQELTGESPKIPRFDHVLSFIQYYLTQPQARVMTVGMICAPLVAHFTRNQKLRSFAIGYVGLVLFYLAYYFVTTDYWYVLTGQQYFSGPVAYRMLHFISPFGIIFICIVVMLCIKVTAISLWRTTEWLLQAMRRLQDTSLPHPQTKGVAALWNCFISMPKNFRGILSIVGDRVMDLVLSIPDLRKRIFGESRWLSRTKASFRAIFAKVHLQFDRSRSRLASYPHGVVVAAVAAHLSLIVLTITTAVMAHANNPGFSQKRCSRPYFSPLERNAIVNYLEQRIALGIGRPFEGSVVSIVGPIDQNVHVWVSNVSTDYYLWYYGGNDLRTIGFWKYRIPTLNQVSISMTPQYYLTTTEFLAEIGNKQTRNFVGITKLDPAKMALWGVRYIVTDRVLSVGEQRVEMPVEVGPSSRHKSPIRLYELPAPNKGDYSPIEALWAGSAKQTLRIMRNHDFDGRKSLVSDIDLAGDYQPVSNAKMTIADGGIKVSATSPGTSLLVLPVQYSHCWVPSQSSRVELFRANLMQLGIRFSGTLNVHLKFEFAPLWHSSCRRKDAHDAERLSMTEGRSDTSR
ncbi:MAG: hypothetical protein AB7E67_06465 [Xanthobacteraceae bacterium]